MKKEYLNALEDALEEYNVKDKKAILKKYSKKYDFGHEADMTDEEIEAMLGDPYDIAMKAAGYTEEDNVEEKFNFVACGAAIDIKVKTLADEVYFVYKDVSEAEVNFIDTDPENYVITKTDNKLEVIYKKSKFLSLNRNDNGKLYIYIPLANRLGELSISTASGKVDIPNIIASNVNISLVSGDLSLESLECKNLTLNTVSANVKAKKIKNVNGSFDTVSGNIYIDIYSTDKTKFNTISGEVIIPVAVGEINSSAISGDIKVNGDANGESLKRFFKGLFNK